MKRLRLLFLTGSRGEWGYIRPILRHAANRPDVECRIAVTNMHLLPSFGQSVLEIEADGFNVDHRLFAALDGYNHITTVKSLGVLIQSMADVVACARPDWIVLAGDRPEQLAGAITGAFCYIPVAHIQAGEVSGNIDGMTRHALGKYVHLHLASNRDAAERLVRLGEEPHRVHEVGAPQLDELVEGRFSPPDRIAERYGIDPGQRFLLVVQHPVTEEFDRAEAQIAATMSALRCFDLPKIIILPNNDAGSLMVRAGIDAHRHGAMRVFANLPREDYLGLMAMAACMVGNSSSALLEAPTFQLPAVNIGRRQLDRVQGSNVINADFDHACIVGAIQSALSPRFRASLDGNCDNPYGDGRSAERILRLLTETPIDDALLVKRLTY
jgi:GDP/UDP-N,N'-diacetylbacillosamine 2-epimerase (hydrolysing)